jgi:hypothetical protein
MANVENLRPGEYKLSQEEAKKGGINSGKARREKKTMKQVLEMMLNEIPIDEDNKNKLTNQQLATLGLIKGARQGNATNYRTILETLGELVEGESTATPTLKLEIVDNSNLEKTLWGANKNDGMEDIKGK